MSNCPKCNQPLNIGNIKKGKNGRREHRKCPEANQLHSNKPVVPIQSTEAKAKTNEAKAVKTNEATARLFISNRKYRLFVPDVIISKIDRIAASGGRTVTLTAQVTDPDLPDREPEYFQGLTEVVIGGRS